MAFNVAAYWNIVTLILVYTMKLKFPFFWLKLCFCGWGSSSFGCRAAGRIFADIPLLLYSCWVTTATRRSLQGAQIIPQIQPRIWDDLKMRHYDNNHLYSAFLNSPRHLTWIKQNYKQNTEHNKQNHKGERLKSRLKKKRWPDDIRFKRP